MALSSASSPSSSPKSQTPIRVLDSDQDIVMENAIFIDLTDDSGSVIQMAARIPEFLTHSPLTKPKSETPEHSGIAPGLPNAGAEDDEEPLLVSPNPTPAATITSPTSAVTAAPGELRKYMLTKKKNLTPEQRAAGTRLDAQKLQESAAQFRASLNIGVSPDHAPNEENVTAEVTGAVQDRNDDTNVVDGDTVVVDDDGEAEHAAASAKFELLKKEYEEKQKKGQTEYSEDIAFKKAFHAEELRLRCRNKRLDYLAQERAQIPDADRMFFSDEDRSMRPSASDSPVHDSQGAEQSVEPASRKFKQNRSNRVPASALEESMRVGMEASTAKEEKSGKKRERRSKGTSNKKSSKDKIDKSKGKKEKKSPKPKGKRGPRKKGPQLANISSLLTNNVIANAQANKDQEAQPTFTTKNKKNALQELIASIPEGQRSMVSADKTALDQATRQFSRSMKADANGGWLLTGMTSSLRHYQLLGAAFMRERENSGKRPYGGIQSDDMGLGKTVMAIANILDGKPSDRSPNRTTLIICPPALCSQWMQEIAKHTVPGAMGEVIVYRAGTRVMSADPVKTLSSIDVIITSYGEILKSYPHCEAPAHLVTEERKQKWWKDHYEENRGVLHRIYFRRIILDEAQAIKNHLSKTSVAVRGLSGKYRWALSGTPVQNSLSEFYPFFAFLKVEHTGTYDTFNKNFCKKGSEAAKTRLQAFLTNIMVRRTHEDKLFGRPILKLPNISTKTITLEFNEIERSIYRIVRDRFVSKIKVYAGADSLEKKYQSVFVLLLRLRQLTSHILLIQKTLTDLLEAEDLEQLWKLILKAEAMGHDDGIRNTLEGLEQALVKRKATPKEQHQEHDREAPASTHPSNEEPTAVNHVPGKTSIGFAAKFRKYLQNLRNTGEWQTINERSLCHACGSIPDQPHVTSCMHIYCKGCLESMSWNAADLHEDKASCIECGAEFEGTEPCHAYDDACLGTASSSPVRSPTQKTRGGAHEEEDFDWYSGPTLASAKVNATRRQIEDWLEQDSTAKILIFVQFRGLVKILSRICLEKEWGHAAYHGGMNFVARDNAVSDFSENPKTKVMIASMKAGGVGLNLTAANRVIIIDLWWNESVETQAFCRVFRIGQERPVEIVRFVVKDTVDTDIIKMQERKTTEIDQAMVERHRPSRFTIEELLRLFGDRPIDSDGDAILDENGDEFEPFIMVQDEAENDDHSDMEMPVRVPARPF